MLVNRALPTVVRVTVDAAMRPVPPVNSIAAVEER